VTVLGDWNEDIRSDMVVTPLKNLGFQDAITSMHHNNLSNTQLGQLSIDEIFLPSDWIPLITRGYLASDQGVPSDHRAVWVDLPIDLFGWNSQPISTPLQAQ